MMDEIICYCKNITKAEIEIAINNGAKTLKDIQKITNACTGNQCNELNPSKQCCSVEISAMLKITPPEKSNCCCCK